MVWLMTAIVTVPMTGLMEKWKSPVPVTPAV